MYCIYKRLVLFLFLLVGLNLIAQPVVNTTTYTRTLLKATDAEAARAILGVSAGGGATNAINVVKTNGVTVGSGLTTLDFDGTTFAVGVSGSSVYITNIGAAGTVTKVSTRSGDGILLTGNTNITTIGTNTISINTNFAATIDYTLYVSNGILNRFLSSNYVDTATLANGTNSIKNYANATFPTFAQLADGTNSVKNYVDGKNYVTAAITNGLAGTNLIYGIAAGANITITTNGYQLTIAGEASGSGSGTVTNVATRSGEGIILTGNTNVTTSGTNTISVDTNTVATLAKLSNYVDTAFFDVVAGTNIVLVTNENTVTINSTATGSGGNTNAYFLFHGATNSSYPNGLKLTAGTGITLTSNATELTIASTAGSGATNAISTVSSNGVSIGTQMTGLNFVPSTNTIINITSNAGVAVVTISSTASGGNVYSSSNNVMTATNQFAAEIQVNNILQTNVTRYIVNNPEPTDVTNILYSFAKTIHIYEVTNHVNITAGTNFPAAGQFIATTFMLRNFGATNQNLTFPSTNYGWWPINSTNASTVVTNGVTALWIGADGTNVYYGSSR